MVLRNANPTGFDNSWSHYRGHSLCEAVLSTAKPLWAVIAVLVLCALLAVRGRKGALLRRFTGTFFLFGLFSLLLVGAVLIVLAPFQDWGQSEELDLSYDEYVARGKDPSFDPEGAFNISYRLNTTRDSYDEWRKLDLSPQAFDTLVARTSAYMEESNAKDGGDEGTTTSVSPSRNSFPEDWPQPESDTPPWWDPPKAEDVVRRCWEWRREESRLHAKRSKGWYWVYDSGAGRLWTWEWNRQHR